MNFSTWAINKPIPSVLLFLLLCALGLVGFQKLPVQHLPDLDFPTVNVTASLPGASPSTLETEVTRRIEDSFAALGGIRHITSTVTDGVSLTVVQFELEKNPQEAVSDVRNALEGIRNELPAEMQSPTISRLSTAGGAIVNFAVRSDRMSEAELSWFVDNTVEKSLLGAPGVGEVNRVGGVEREVRVELDPVRLDSLNVTASDISMELNRVLREYPGGTSNLGGMEQSIRTISTVTSSNDVASMRIALPDGKTVRLDTLGKVWDSHAEREEVALVDGKHAVTFGVRRARGSSELEVIEAVRGIVADINERYPHVEIREINNSVAPVKNNYKTAMSTLYEGAILAILAVWLFLRDWRATSIAAVALPLSIIPTFGVIYLLGFQLNSITLLALTLIIGVLVDDAIVEIENIDRHLKSGKSAKTSAMIAANEIGLAVVATSFTLVAVFLPTGLMSGMAGMFFMQFGWTASIAVLFSLMVARLLTPMMAAHFMKAKPDPEEEKPAGQLISTYLATVGKSIRHPFVTTGLAVLFLLASVFVLSLLPTNFVDAEDQDQILVHVEAAPGSRIDETIRLSEKAREIIARHKEVENVYTTIGAGGSENTRTASLVASLTPIAESDRRFQKEIEVDLREELAAVAGARIMVGGNSSGQQMKIVLKSDNSELLNSTAQELVGEIRRLPGLGGVRSSASLSRPELHIIPDSARASELGVSNASISEAVRVATSGDYDHNLPRLNLPSRQIYVRTQIPLSERVDVQTIKSLNVMSRKGAVPLSSVAEVVVRGGPSQIDRLDRSRSVTITIDTMNRPLGDINEQLAGVELLNDLPAEVERVVSGDAEQQTALFDGFAFSMVAGVLCVYAVLVLLFHDFLQPLTILVALPLSAGGAFAGLALLGYSLSLSSLIGLIMLMGIVSKNSILLVEFTIMSREERGLSRTEAIVDACRKRARPIIMTSFAMIAGMLPMALQFGVPSAFRGPMAVAVIGGLVTSTALSLLVVPAVYVLVDDLKEKLRSVFLPKSRSIPTMDGRSSA